MPDKRPKPSHVNSANLKYVTKKNRYFQWVSSSLKKEYMRNEEYNKNTHVENSEPFQSLIPSKAK